MRDPCRIDQCCPEHPGRSSFWAGRWTTGLKTKWTNFGQLLAIRHEGELKRTRCISATKIINCKILCTRYEVPCLLGKAKPLFLWKDSESCWIAQEMLVDALIETGSPEFGLLAFKILALIHCCALCRTDKSAGNVAVGFWGFLGIARESFCPQYRLEVQQLLPPEVWTNSWE